VRNPLVMLGLGPAFMFLIAHRFLPAKGSKRSLFLSVHITNLAVLIIIVVAALTIGLKAYVLIQLPIILIGGAAGVWLFYVQHQFKGVYWARHNEWDPIRAAMEGSSYYKLPRVLQWVSGNIGLHHIHHLRARIPNYNLQRCQDEVPGVQTAKPLTLWASLSCIRLNLWDEERQQLVSFSPLGAPWQGGALGRLLHGARDGAGGRRENKDNS
jgi:omega-6 fatty acid desaturase (delta-12 desaturase)